MVDLVSLNPRINQNQSNHPDKVNIPATGCVVCIRMSKMEDETSSMVVGVLARNAFDLARPFGPNRVHFIAEFGFTHRADSFVTSSANM